MRLQFGLITKSSTQLHPFSLGIYTVDLNLNESTTTSWAVFNKDYGGNCCEHYLATTIDGTYSTLEENTVFPTIEDTNGTLTSLEFSQTNV